MAAATDRAAALCLVASLTTAVASPSFADEPTEDDPPLRPSTLLDPDTAEDSASWTMEEVRLRFAYFDQRGTSIHSQADYESGLDGIPRGSVDLEVYQPMIFARLRQSERVTHTLTLPIDVVTSASADALDAISAASRVNEAFTVDITTEISPTSDDHLRVRYGAHIEEPFRSGFGGLAYVRDLAEDNFTLELRGDFTFDVFDPISPQGFDSGSTQRKTVLGSVAVSQLLSPTTIASASYGLTYQWGTLQNTWNSVPIMGGGLRVGELFPDTRLRHAVTGAIAQHLPSTRTTLRASYRYYRDDFDLDAHTISTSLYQWLGRRVWVGLDYRWHDQSGVPFFTPLAPADASDNPSPRTADEDLASYRAHQLGGKMTFYLSRQEARGDESLTLGYERYWRPHVDIDVVSIGYARVF